MWDHEGCYLMEPKTKNTVEPQEVLKSSTRKLEAMITSFLDTHVRCPWRRKKKKKSGNVKGNNPYSIGKNFTEHNLPFVYSVQLKGNACKHLAQLCVDSAAAYHPVHS